MEIIQKTTTEEENTMKDGMIGMGFVGKQKEEKTTLAAIIQAGISDASQTMDCFMKKLENRKLVRGIEPSVGEEFVPTQEEIEKISNSYSQLLHSNLIKSVTESSVTRNSCIYPTNEELGLAEMTKMEESAIQKVKK